MSITGSSLVSHLNIQNDCPFSRCKCSKCSEESTIPHESDNKSEDLIESTIDCKSEDNRNKWREDISKLNSLEPTAQLDAVRALALRLSQLDASHHDLRTAVLYTLLKKNDFSFENTRRMLTEARTLIIESLVLPAFDTNRHYMGNKRTFNSVDSSDELISTKKCRLSQNKAKKSFSRMPLNTNCDKISQLNGSTASSSAVSNAEKCHSVSGLYTKLQTII